MVLPETGAPPVVFNVAVTTALPPYGPVAVGTVSVVEVWVPIVTLAVAELLPGTGSTVDLLLMLAVLLITVPLARVLLVVAVIRAERVSPEARLGKVINWAAVAVVVANPPPLTALAAVWL